MNLIQFVKIADRKSCFAVFHYLERKGLFNEISDFVPWNKNTDEQMRGIHIQIRSRETV